MPDHLFDQLKLATAADKLSSEAAANIVLWLENIDYAYFHKAILDEIKAGNWELLDDSFYARVRVGTGGIRGPLGVGPNRINTRTIGEAAQALSNFMHGFGQDAVDGGVVIGHEVRKLSTEFAKVCCEVFAANGIKTYLFDHYRSTPELSFAVRELGVTAGVQLTASHNPRTDNGFKFYWSDGGQVVPPLDQKFMELVTAVSEIKRMPYAEAVAKNMVVVVGEDLDRTYVSRVIEQSLSSSRSATIAFSPLHGAGSTNVLPVLEQAGFAVQVVEVQRQPDENFPTAHGDLINPEFPEVMALVVKLAEATGSDVAIMSDPDADRLGVAVKQTLNDTTMERLSGNQVGIVLTEYILSEIQEAGQLRPDDLIIETFVTSSLISKIARSYGVTAVDDLLVGFKFIGEIVTNLEDSSHFLFAAEESLGYLRGDYARDKDAAVAALLMAELTSKLKDQDKTVVEYLDDIYQKNGYYKNLLLPAELGKGRVGKERIVAVMQGLRAKPPKELAGLPVKQVLDELPEAQRAADKYVAAANGDQLTFVLSDDGLTRVTARPSGTEPIIKFYIQHWASVDGTDLATVKSDVDDLAGKLEQAIDSYARDFIIK